MSAVKKLKPTHHVTHTKVGAMLKPLCKPTRPAITTTKKSDNGEQAQAAHEQARGQESSAAGRETGRSGGTGRRRPAPLLREKRARGTKASTTAAAAP